MCIGVYNLGKYNFFTRLKENKNKITLVLGALLAYRIPGDLM